MGALVFDSLLEVPLDEYTGDDGDDQNVPAGQDDHDPPRLLSLSSSAPAAPAEHLAVPFFYVKQRDRGPHVKALKRALSRAGYGTWIGKLFTPLMGVFAIRSLNEFKHSHGLPPNGVYDRAAHAKLAGFYDAYSIRYLLNAQAVKPTQDQLRRNAFLAELMYLYNRRSILSYTQRRAFDTRKPPSGLDCSASGEWAAKWSGLNSLSGYSGFGYGNTDSQIARFRRLNAMHVTIAAAAVGDPVFYGRNGDPSHVAFWIGAGRVWSFGAYPVKILDHSYRHDKIGAANLLTGQ